MTISGRKLFFFLSYTTVLAGVFFSALYILSSLHSSRHIVSAPWLEITSFHKDSHTLKHEEVSAGRRAWNPPTPGTPFPPLETFHLTKELVSKIAENNTIVVTFGNFAFMDFILNWVQHLTNVHVYNLLLGALDMKSLEALYWKGIPVFNMGASMTSDDVGWGSALFHKLGRQKVLLLNILLSFGFDVLLCDTDMVWLKNPLPYFGRFPEADLFVTTDQIGPTVMDDTLTIWYEAGNLNIGILYGRSTDSSLKLANEWKDKLLADGNSWDQAVFNELVQRKYGPAVEGESGLAYAFDGSLKLGVLPIALFSSGHAYFLQHEGFSGFYQGFGTSITGTILARALYMGELEVTNITVGTTTVRLGLPKPIATTIANGAAGLSASVAAQELHHRLRLEPYAVHATYQYAGKEGKRHSFREAMLFFDPPEYYDVPGGFLSFTVDIPRHLLLNEEKTVDAHFSLVNYQLKQIRTGLAIASLLNRTLVMPPLWCKFDRIYYGHTGILPGTMTTSPFTCPMNYVFNIDTMLSDLPESEFGPRIDFREHSFLKNPSVPRQVKESLLEVHVCQKEPENCYTRKPGGLAISKSSSEEKILQVFSSYRDTKVIHFSSMDLGFHNFTDKERNEKFRKRVKKYVSYWCCLMKSSYMGHIFYDIYWDEKPDWKPKAPQNAEEDHPPL